MKCPLRICKPPDSYRGDMNNRAFHLCAEHSKIKPKNQINING
tara:strand:+ start:2357 stop:2485 length:129 start_codon:yes stop_codon:yes gene_type:complete